MSLEERIGLGTVQFGLAYGVSNRVGQTSPEEVSRILSFARSRNIQLLDTASAYGSAEKVLGHNGVASFQVVSKFVPSAAEGTLQEQLGNSLKNLRLDSLYGYLAHRPMSLLKNPQQWTELKAFRESGRVEKIGYSLNAPDELERLLEAGFIPDLVQIPFNYADRRFEKPIAGLKEQGCEIHARSVFLQGLFFKRADTLPDFFDDIKPLLTSLQAMASPFSGALLDFVLRKSFIDKVIIGVEDCLQLSENLESLQLAEKLPEPDTDLPERIVMPVHWPAISN